MHVQASRWLNSHHCNHPEVDEETLEGVIERIGKLPGIAGRSLRTCESTLR